jgi:hypothetical protein
MFGSIGPTELILVLLVVAIVGVPIAIAVLFNKRFKKSGGNKSASEQPVAPFSSPETVGKRVKALLVASLVLAVVAVISGFLQVELLSRLADGSSYTMEEVAQNDSRQQLIGVFQVLLWIGTAVAFLVWFYRMNKNLPSLGQTGLLFTPGWAVGFFFVPFFNLVRPFQAMRAAWHGSDPSRLGFDFASHKTDLGSRLGTPALVGWWWALFLISNVIGNAAARLLISQKTATGLQTGSALLVLSDLLDIPSALVAIRLVGHLTKWQVEKEKLISQQHGQVATAPLVSPQ